MQLDLELVLHTYSFLNVLLSSKPKRIPGEIVKPVFLNKGTLLSRTLTSPSLPPYVGIPPAELPQECKEED